MKSYAEPFEIVLAHLDGYARIKLRGDFDYRATVAHREQLREITDLRRRVVVDLADLRYIDGSGVHYLLVLSDAHDGALRLENVPLNIIRVLDFMGLRDWFELGTSA